MKINGNTRNDSIQELFLASCLALGLSDEYCINLCHILTTDEQKEIFLGAFMNYEKDLMKADLEERKTMICLMIEEIIEMATPNA